MLLRLGFDTRLAAAFSKSCLVSSTMHELRLFQGFHNQGVKL